MTGEPEIPPPPDHEPWVCRDCGEPGQWVIAKRIDGVTRQLDERIYWASRCTDDPDHSIILYPEL